MRVASPAIGGRAHMLRSRSHRPRDCGVDGVVVDVSEAFEDHRHCGSYPWYRAEANMVGT